MGGKSVFCFKLHVYNLEQVEKPYTVYKVCFIYSEPIKKVLKQASTTSLFQDWKWQFKLQAVGEGPAPPACAFTVLCEIKCTFNKTGLHTFHLPLGFRHLEPSKWVWHRRFSAASSAAAPLLLWYVSGLLGGCSARYSTCALPSRNVWQLQTIPDFTRARLTWGGKMHEWMSRCTSRFYDVTTP